VIAISARDRGSAVHEVLERFFDEVIAEGAPDPDQPWDAAHQARLRELVREVADELEAAGRTGRPLHWRLAREDLFVLLADFLSVDDDYRRTHGARPDAVELAFGIAGADPVVIDLPDDRRLRFRGLVDRVDRTDAGDLLVSDYKTGKGGAYVGLDASDPVQGGELLQLGLYAEAARQRYDPDAAVDAHYWMVDPGPAYARFGYPWTDERRQRFLDVVTAIVEGIEAGVFPAVPGEWDGYRNTHRSCTYCDFDRVCPRARGEQAVAKVDAPQLRRRDPLAWDGAE
jgi:RecB family exonuclease